jgi:hypothetical protein
MYRNYWLRVVLFCLVALGLMVYPLPGAAAQSPIEEPSFWDAEMPAEPITEKPSAPAALDDDKAVIQLDHQLFIPNVQAGPSVSTEVEAAAITAWSTILLETFEGVWPPAGGNWFVYDYNGGTPSNKIWDDTSSKAYAGSWSAHPADGSPYENNQYTYMQYGPFSLVGAIAARLRFYRWLDTEAGWDFLTWQYSCNGTAHWSGSSRSGYLAQWKLETTSLDACLGQPAVYVRFNFTSDSIIPDAGVWVDNIHIQRFNP